MSIRNLYMFSQNVFLWEKFSKVTRNVYQVISVGLYSDTKHGKLPDGLKLGLQIRADDMDYGMDKNGQPRTSNLLQTFMVTVLTRKHNVKVGDFVRLLEFDSDNTYVINFDAYLRFRDFEIISDDEANDILK